jgi:alkanesulfonate monooxygenase SsuD/methylene tetrahydromethanopterin reductase-like flavin-dependent oxidoreductase (luciferase family)
LKLGAFVMPSHPPERPLIDGYRWDLEHLSLLDRKGFREAWIGEHYTAAWEPNPAPDLLIAQALMQTENIVLAPGAHLLPYHHPVELAHRVAFLDQIAQGRYMLGVGIGALPSDQLIFDVDGAGGENRRMTAEALEIMLQIWTEGPVDFQGEFWSMKRPDTEFDFLGYHMQPFQKPHPPIGIAGLSPGSETLKFAGERGFLPLSISLNPKHTASHWASVEEGAARTGRTPDRAEWRLTREVYIAETDEEARRLARDGAMGRCWREYLLPFYIGNGMGEHFKNDPSEPDSVVTVDYLIENAWFVGSPATVREKIEQLQHDTGGFGGMLVMIYDFADEQQAWENSLDLLVHEVMPHFPEQP